MDLIIRNARLGTRQIDLSVVEGRIAEIVDAGGEIGSVSPASSVAPTRTLDASGLHVVTGLRNGHTHAAMTLFRGWGDDLPLMEWLEERIWPAESRMTEEDVYAGTRLAILEMIRSGTLHFNDMYWHAPAIARAASEMGVRAHIGAAFVDLGDASVARRWKAAVEAWLEQCGSWGPRIHATVAPHAIYTVSADHLAWLAGLASDAGLLLHIHLSETRGEVEACVAAHGVRPAHLLDRLGLVNDRLIAAHGVFLDADEHELLGSAGATVVTNPAANLKLATGGIFDYVAARAAGVRVILGTDGVASNNNLDLFEEMKLAALLQKHRAEDATALPAREAFALATTTPAEVFGAGSGRIEPGEPADLLLLDLGGPETQPGHDLESDLVYAANGSVVHTTICAGRVLMHDRRIEVADPDEIVRTAGEAAARLTGREHRPRPPR